MSSHPLDHLLDGADKQLTAAIAWNCPNAAFTYFGAGQRRPGDPPGRRVPVLSRGVLDRIGRAQILAVAPVLERRVDIVHVVATVGSGFARFSQLHAALRRWKRAVVVHTVPGITDARTLRGARPLGLTVALTEGTARMLRNAGFGDVRVVPGGIALDRWPAVPRRSSERPTVLFAAHHEPESGWSDLVDAAALLQRAGTHVRLVMAMRTRPGQRREDEEARVIDAARTAGVDDVHVFDRVSNMKELVEQADVVALLARVLAGKADVPVIVLEAMATRRPVVVSDLPSLAHLGDAVRRVEVGDSGGLACAIAELLADDDRWDEVAGLGRALVEREFSDTVMGSRYAELYDEVQSGSR